jgi:hypothetical protein
MLKPNPSNEYWSDSDSPTYVQAEQRDGHDVLQGE